MLTSIAALLLTAAPVFHMDLPPPARTLSTDSAPAQVTRAWICRETGSERTVLADITKPVRVEQGAPDLLHDIYREQTHEGIVHGGWSEGGGNEEGSANRAVYETAQLAGHRLPFLAIVVVQHEHWTVVGFIHGRTKDEAKSCLNDFWQQALKGWFEGLEPAKAPAEALVPFDVHAPAGWTVHPTDGFAQFDKNGNTEARYARILVRTFLLHGESLGDAALEQLPSGAGITATRFQAVDAGVPSGFIDQVVKRDDGSEMLLVHYAVKFNPRQFVLVTLVASDKDGLKAGTPGTGQVLQQVVNLARKQGR